MKILVEKLPMGDPFPGMDRVGAVFPAYNEERNVTRALRATLDAGVGRVVCVDDGSTDRTGELIDRLSSDDRLTAMHHTVNQGKQAAVKHGLAAGLEHSDVDYVAVLDADMQNDPLLLPRLCGHARNHDVVIASRAEGHMPLGRRFANALANLAYRVIAATPLSDVQSGYRIYTREAARYLADNLTARGGYTLEHTSLVLLAAMALQRGRDLRVAEVPTPCTYQGAESSIGVADKLHLTWATLKEGAALARLQRRKAC